MKKSIIVIVIAVICMLGLSWINPWFALVGFILIGGLMTYKIIASANE